MKMNTSLKNGLAAIALGALIASGPVSALPSLESIGIKKGELKLKGRSDPNPRNNCEKAVEGISYKRFCRGLPGGNSFKDYTKLGS